MEMEAYYDESGTHSNSSIICVAGYLFAPEQRQRFDQEWMEVLKAYNLPYFRMSECAHAAGAFRGRKNICALVAKQLIGIIKRRAELGMATSISETDYVEHIPSEWRLMMGSAYSWCIRWAMGLVRDWVERHNFQGTISYFFESGHQHQAWTNRWLRETFGRMGPTDSHRYVSHTFASKVPTIDSPTPVFALQAADLLAWQYRTQKRRESEGKHTFRLDFHSLLGCPHVVSDWSPHGIGEWKAGMIKSLEQAGANDFIPPEV
jgi:Protein of unknown function (DUF3800)